MQQTNKQGQQSGDNSQQQANNGTNKNNVPTNADKQVQEGGYSSKPEQQQTEQEQEDMHSERNLHNLEEGKNGQQPDQKPETQKPGLPRP